MSLADAQRQIATEWIKVWKEIEGQAWTAAEVGGGEGE
jgi:hypothetical protein